MFDLLLLSSYLLLPCSFSECSFLSTTFLELFCHTCEGVLCFYYHRSVICGRMHFDYIGMQWKLFISLKNICFASHLLLFLLLEGKWDRAESLVWKKKTLLLSLMRTVAVILFNCLFQLFPLVCALYID